MENKQNAVPVPRHHWVTAGTVHFVTTVGEGEQAEQQIGQLTLNCIHTTAEQKLTADDLGKIQVNLQQQMHQKVPTPIQVVDVIINSVSWVGLMTRDEFAPAQQEAAAPTPSKEPV